MDTKRNFKSIAVDALTLSPLMAERTQIKTDELLGKEATVMEFDFATITDKGVEKTYPVMLLKEYPKNYYNGGALMCKLCEAWATEYDGDVEAASDALNKAGGVKFSFKKKTTKSGNNLTSVEVV